jgi:myb proto-oncogene protein
MKQGLIKGPWSKQEDEILKEYVKIYGPKNWNALQRLTGYSRCKFCSLGDKCLIRCLRQLFFL